MTRRDDIETLVVRGTYAGADEDHDEIVIEFLDADDDPTERLAFWNASHQPAFNDVHLARRTVTYTRVSPGDLP